MEATEALKKLIKPLQHPVTACHLKDPESAQETFSNHKDRNETLI